MVRWAPPAPAMSPEASHDRLGIHLARGRGPAAAGGCAGRGPAVLCFLRAFFQPGPAEGYFGLGGRHRRQGGDQFLALEFAASFRRSEWADHPWPGTPRRITLRPPRPALWAGQGLVLYQRPA